VLAAPEFLATPEEQERERSAIAARLLDQARLYATEDNHSVAVTSPVTDGITVADAIIDAVEAHSIDLIVMATHGYSGLRRWALGSVADKALHASPCPLLLVRSGG
jgi:nucleotide-binding universal stress UspA family protein